MSVALNVVEVPEGSVVLLSGVEFADAGEANELAGRVVRLIAAAAGHDRFAFIVAPGGADVEVWGPDVDLQAKVNELLGRGDAAGL